MLGPPPWFLIREVCGGGLSDKFPSGADAAGSASTFENHCLEQGLANFFCKVPDGKYFRLHGPQSSVKTTQLWEFTDGLALSLLWLGLLLWLWFNPWPRNFCMPQPKEEEKKKKKQNSESRMVVTRDWGGGMEEWLFNCIEFQFCKMKMFWRSVLQ